MKIGIYDVYAGAKVPNQRIYEDILSFNKIPYDMLSINDTDFLEQLRNINLLIFRWTSKDSQHQLSGILRPLLESLKINYLPNSATSWHYDDKIKQFYLLELHGGDVGAIPVPTKIFFDKRIALEHVKKCKFPLVAKLNKGAGSSNVKLIKKRKVATRYVKMSFSASGMNPNYYDSLFNRIRLNAGNIKKTTFHFMKKYAMKIMNKEEAYWQKHKNYVLFQEFLDGNKFDTRVTTVGNRVHAFRRFVREGDFRASGGEEWDINPAKIDKRMLRIALDFSKKMNFTTMAYDFIYDENQDPRIVEISYMFGQPGFPDFMNGYWDFDLNWHEGRYWPQYFELVDFLGMPTLKCPEIAIPKEWIKNTII